MLKISILASVLVMLSGCGTMADPSTWFGGDDPALKPAKLEDITEVFKPSIIWSRDVGAGAAEEQPGLRPFITESQIFVLDSEGLLTVLDKSSGAVLMEKKTGLPASGGPAVGEGKIFLGTTEAQLIALDRDSAAEIWRSDLSSEVLAAPAVYSGIVVVHTVDGNIFGIDAENGEQRWRYDRKIPILTLRGSSSPVIYNDSVICGLAGGKLVSLSLDSGEVEWEHNVTIPGGRSDLDRLTDIDSDPLIYNGSVYATSYRGDIAAIGAVSGKEFWSRKMSSYSGMAINWQLLYVTDDQGYLWALDPDTGAAKWRNEDLANRSLSAPAIHGDYVVIGDFEGYLHWVNSADGKIVARTRLSRAPIIAPPRTELDILYVLGNDGELAAIALPAVE